MIRLVKPIATALAILFGMGALLGLVARLNQRWEQFILRPTTRATADQIGRCVDILTQRIAIFKDEYRVASGRVEAAGDGTIRLKLRSFKGCGDMAQRLARRSVLELRLAKPVDDPNAPPPDGYELLYQVDRRFNLTNLHEIDEIPRPFHVKVQPEMVCTSLRSVRYFTTGMNPPRPHIDIEFRPDDAERFRQVAAAHVGERLALVIDGEVRAAPELSPDSAAGAAARIDALATRIEARALAGILEAGALPVELKVERISDDSARDANAR